MGRQAPSRPEAGGRLLGEGRRSRRQRGGLRRERRPGRRSDAVVLRHEPHPRTVRGPARGRAEIWVDGRLVRTMDLYAPIGASPRSSWRPASPQGRARRARGGARNASPRQPRGARVAIDRWVVTERAERGRADANEPRPRAERVTGGSNGSFPARSRAALDSSTASHERGSIACRRGSWSVSPKVRCSATAGTCSSWRSAATSRRDRSRRRWSSSIRTPSRSCIASSSGPAPKCSRR